MFRFVVEFFDHTRPRNNGTFS